MTSELKYMKFTESLKYQGLRSIQKCSLFTVHHFLIQFLAINTANAAEISLLTEEIGSRLCVGC